MQEFRLKHLPILTLTCLGQICLGPIAFAQIADPNETGSRLSNSNETVTIPAPLAGEIIEWEICNETSFVLRHASAFVRSDRMQTVGWTTTTPGSCATVMTPKSSPRFLYAESLAIHRGGIREWKGKIELCASEEDFVSDSTDNCALANFDTRNYFAVNPTERRTALIESTDFNDKAEIAGIQRLLQDAGYNITRIDGLSGRRTLRTISEAKSDLGVDKDADNQKFIEALMPAAKTSRSDVGLDICNDSSTRIFGAVAYQAGNNWSSRGWWSIDPKSCVKPIDTSLIDTQTHVFALQETFKEDGSDGPDKRLRSETVTPSPFCIAESRFSALGRENCQDKGYSAANFRPIPTDLDGQTLRLTDADFVTPGEIGLRP